MKLAYLFLQMKEEIENLQKEKIEVEERQVYEALHHMSNEFYEMLDMASFFEKEPVVAVLEETLNILK
jgi:hypothetical protein